MHRACALRARLAGSNRIADSCEIYFGRYVVWRFLNVYREGIPGRDSGRFGCGIVVSPPAGAARFVVHVFHYGVDSRVTADVVVNS